MLIFFKYAFPLQYQLIQHLGMIYHVSCHQRLEGPESQFERHITTCCAQTPPSQSHALEGPTAEMKRCRADIDLFCAKHPCHADLRGLITPDILGREKQPRQHQKRTSYPNSAEKDFTPGQDPSFCKDTTETFLLFVDFILLV